MAVYGRISVEEAESWRRVAEQVYLDQISRHHIPARGSIPTYTAQELVNYACERADDFILGVRAYAKRAFEEAQAQDESST